MDEISFGKISKSVTSLGYTNIAKESLFEVFVVL